MPELRKDPVTREWVIIALERARRPSDFVVASSDPNEGESAFCPFCPGNENLCPPEIMAFREPSSQRTVPVGGCA